jgi:hypothetical protein
VTQVPKPAKVYARRSQSTLENGYRLMMRHMWPGVESTDELVTIPMLKTTTHKIGIDADALAAEIAGSVFVQELIGESTGAPPEPGDQAQVYSESDVLRDRDPSTGAYVELELTSPRATAARQPTLKVVWSLSDGEPAQALRSR